jgi:hypothetical protein
VKRLNKIVEFCVSSSIWVAISVASLVGVTYRNLELPMHYYLLLFVFFGTIFGYNFIKHFEKVQMKGLRLKKSTFDYNYFVKEFQKLKSKEKTIFIISCISFLMSFFFLFKLKSETILLLIIPVLLTFCYAVSLGYKTLRNISGIKIYVVAFVWAFVSVLLPIIESEIVLSTDVWIMTFQRFVFVVVLILPFEIRDLSIDEEILRTLPQNIGVRNTKLYGLLLLMLFYFLGFFKDELLEVNLTVMPLVFLITLLFLVLAKEKQSKYYSSFFVEGIPILWVILLMIF